MRFKMSGQWHEILDWDGVSPSHIDALYMGAGSPIEGIEELYPGELDNMYRLNGRIPGETMQLPSGTLPSLLFIEAGPQQQGQEAAALVGPAIVDGRPDVSAVTLWHSTRQVAA